MVNPSLLASAKDIMYLICTPINTLLPVVILVAVTIFWQMKKDKKQRDREKQIRQGESDRADIEKIAAILSNDYSVIEQHLEQMKTVIKKSQSTKIIVRPNHEPGLTGFELLRYMCQPDQQRVFKTVALDSFLSSVEEMVELFQKFRINLSCIWLGRPCPEAIKSELGPIITEIATLIYPFLSETRRNTITKVLRYINPTCISTLPQTPTPLAEIERDLPYVNHFRLQTSGEMTFEMSCTNSNIKNIELFIEHPTILEKRTDICEKIKLFWTNQRVQGVPSNSILEHINSLDLTDTNNGNMLHLIRLLIFMLSEHSSLFNDEAFQTLDTYLTNIDRSQVGDDANIRFNENYSNDLINHMNNLQNGLQRPLLREPETTGVLKHMNTIWETFVRSRSELLKVSFGDLSAAPQSAGGLSSASVPEAGALFS